MDPPRKYERKDTSYQSLRTDSSLEETKEVKLPLTNVGGGGDGGGQIWPKSDSGRVAGEGSSFGFLGAGAAGAKNKDENKGYGDQDQSTGETATIIQEIQDDADLVMICSAFRRLQLKDRQEHGRPACGESEAEPVERSEPEDGASK